MLEVHGFDACDPLSVVIDFRPWLDKGVKDYVAIVIDD